jgi:hypothetical protein
VRDLSEEIASGGFAIVPNVLGAQEIVSLLGAIESATDANSVAGRGGIRNLLDRVACVRKLSDSPVIRALIDPILGKDAFPARGILFDKTPAANWKVPWHQDLTIAVQNRIDVPGFGPWTVKDGVVHVQPPTEILEKMLAIRIHLDDCYESNGPVRVIPRSHLDGRLTAGQIQAIVNSTSPVLCTVGRGGVLSMRPLLLHASSVASVATHRRVIHLEFAASELWGGLRWYSESHA